MSLTQSVPSLAQKGLNVAMSAVVGLGVTTSPVNTTVSNVPGSPVPMYMAGAKMVKTHGIGFLMHGTGPFNTITSYNGELCISFLACREQMPDPAVYHSCIEQAYQDIRDAVLTSKVTKKKPVKKTRAQKPSKKTPVKKTPLKKAAVQKKA